MDLLKIEVLGFHVACHICFLAERAATVDTDVRFHAGMPSEVISYVSAFLKHLSTALDFALVVPLELLGFRVKQLDRSIPVIWNTVKSLLSVRSGYLLKPCRNLTLTTMIAGPV